jgi:hypothetical protein
MTYPTRSPAKLAALAVAVAAISLACSELLI